MQKNAPHSPFSFKPERYKDSLLLISSALLVAFVASFAFDPHASATPASQPAAIQIADNQPAKSSDKQQTTRTKTDRAQNIENRIATLHEKLQITSEQSAAWDAVTLVMRENEMEVSRLIRERHQDPQSMTAVDDLRSYAAITQEHADGAKRLLTAFQPLYDDMSAAQRKEADAVFGRFEGHPGRKPMKNNQ